MSSERQFLADILARPNGEMGDEEMVARAGQAWRA
jgi:hypothetical protein